MKKKLLVVIVALLVMVGCVYFAAHKKSTSIAPATETQSDISTWKTYRNTEYGFSIKLPQPYFIEETFVATSTPWGSRGLLVISRYEDKTPRSMRPTYGVVSVQVNLQRQPVVASGEIFHNVTDYFKSGAPDLTMQGIPDPVGGLEVVNGIQALTYHTLPGDVVEVPGDIYFFIKDDLIYEFSFDASDPNEKAMLGSITWE